jgi:hypothetical protein
MTPEKYYQSRLQTFSLLEKKLTGMLNRVSIFRLISMILFAYLLVKGINHNNYLLITGSVISIVFFLYFVSLHKRKSDEREKTRAIIEINQNEIKALKGDYSTFYDGTEFLDPEHEFTYDLDIFGPKSVYQFICRCCTLKGRQSLASRFLNSPFDEQIVYLNREIHKELSTYPEFLQNYLSTGNIIEEKKEDEIQLRLWLDKDKKVLPAFTLLLAFILMASNTVLLISSAFVPGIFNYLIITILMSWLFYGTFLGPINRYHSEIGKKQEIIKKYYRLSKTLLTQQFENPELKSNSNTVSQATVKVKHLERLMDFFDTRLNLFAGVILNSVFLLDFHLIFLLEKWRKENRDILKRFFDIHAETDAYISGAMFLFNHPDYIFPIISENGLSAKATGHPLIKPGKCIVNDFEFEKEENIIIITGANMAGKSTFLRTLGVNLILAGSGFPVMASDFRFEICPVITGMRTTDSIAESESYFFAELKRLKRIMDRLRNNEKLYVFLDEILKGTNSIDKHKGSEELLKNISEFRSKVFIATHDLDLGKLEKTYPDSIRNYHFESFVENNELRFDYKIRKGVAVNMNASFLLRKMNILNN